MKNLKLIILLLIATNSLLGCKKKGGGSKDNTYYLKATVDGTLIESSASIDGTINKQGNNLGIYGRYDGNVAGLDINLTQFTGPGTYALTPASDLTRPLLGSGIYRIDKTSRENHIFSTALNNGSGKVVVTSYENNILSGTFEFKGYNTSGELKTVSNGSFRVKLKVN